ncbi:MAG TPA: Spy/CpxP family protein refolding chaperone [Ferrovibrio sp.]|uniref:Spy/CpxP family protein refolding chaperone n=1 Tax=Ferrovibrio sp. TaxID=1917215 RepID=UPI002B4B7775|nr:Spy/CpxP family protein refolding chaperone [Ferrovibrio sp.]HLT76258.1 Spy/CpxP family protein refolding chaperone [Ferrovibrio sp.]
MRRIAAIAALALTLAAGIGLGAIGRHHTTQNDTGETAAAAPVVVPVNAEDVSGAERNLFPAPHTAIFLANDLGLSQDQRLRLHELQQALDAEIATIGRRIQAEEARLDRAFMDNVIDIGRIDGLTARIGALQAQRRAARLRAHLATRDLLSPEQLLRYAELRGFQAAEADAYVDELDR